MEWQVIVRLKTEQRKLGWKKKLSHKFKEFQRAARNQRTENSSFPYDTNKMRASKVYHVKFPHILKELEVQTVQFLGGDYQI